MKKLYIILRLLSFSQSCFSMFIILYTVFNILYCNIGSYIYIVKAVERFEYFIHLKLLVLYVLTFYIFLQRPDILKIVCYNGENSVQNMLRCHFVIDVSTRLSEYICASLYKNIRHEKYVLKREAEKYTYYYGLRPMIYM